MAADRATLIKDGERRAVDVGSQEAQKAFGEGFTLETGETSRPEAQGVADLSGTLGNTSQSQSATQFSSLRNIMDSLTREAASSGPNVRDVLNNFKSQVGGQGVVDPSISGAVIGQEGARRVGNVSDIFRQTLRTVDLLERNKVEQQANVNNLMGQLAQSGMLGQLTGAEFDQIQQTGILPMETLQKINDFVVQQREQPDDAPDKKFISGTDNQQAGVFDPATGQFKPIDTNAVQPSGNFTTFTLNDRAFNVDQIAAPSLNTLNTQLAELGATTNGQTGLILGAVESSTFRTAEQQKALFDAGKTPLDGTNGISKHQSGLAIDVMPDQEYISSIAPTMNANGWFQTAGADDLGHFEFLGKQEPVGADAEVNSFVEQVKSGKLTSNQALNQVSKDKKENLSIELGALPAEVDQDIALVKEKADIVSGLKEHSGLNSSVGPTAPARFAVADRFGAKQDFIASIEQVVSGLSLEALIDAKSRGATFGALSDSEMRILASAATKIGTWTLKDEGGNVTGYNTSEKSFKKELDTISKLLKKGLKGTEGTGDGQKQKIGDTINVDGTSYKVVGFDEDGEPLVDPI